MFICLVVNTISLKCHNQDTEGRKMNEILSRLEAGLNSMEDSFEQTNLE